MTLFVDTNTLLHYQPVDQINWNEVIPGEQLTLAYSLAVIDEIDKHTHHPRLSARAKFVQGQLMKFLKAGQITGEVRIITVPKPHIRVLQEMDLDASQADQWILASIVEYKKTRLTEKVAVLTSDVGMQLRAEVMNIQVVLLEEKYSIREESEEQKELKKLRQENTILKNAIPKLDIRLITKDQEEYSVTLPDFEQYVESEMRNVRRENPKLHEYSGYFIGSGSDYATRAQIVTYNNQLDNYYEYYRRYLEARADLYEAEMLTIELTPFLGNTGSVPGRNLDIEFSFPDLVSVHIKAPKERITEPNKPFPPTLGVVSQLLFSRDQPSYQDYQTKHLFGPQIIIYKSGVTRVEITVDNIKQQTVEALDVLYATFKDATMVSGFNVEYAIRADNVPNVVTGKLNVKVMEI